MNSNTLNIGTSPTAWTVYWQANNLESFIANNKESDSNVFSCVWRDFLKPLPTDAKILDLATGNGAVPLKLLTINSQLNITGVDQANISPVDYLPSEKHLRKVNFIGNTDICRLPFDDNHFDGVTSQFGFEYANKDNAASEFLRVLKPEHFFQLIVHNANSDVVQPAKKILNELTLVLAEQGLVSKLLALVKNQILATELETFYKSFLTKHKGDLSERISGRIFQFAEQILNQIEKGYAKSSFIDSTKSLANRINAEHERLRQLTTVALSKEQAESLCQQFKPICSTVNLEPVLIKDSLYEPIIAWSISGVKSTMN